MSLNRNHYSTSRLMGSTVPAQHARGTSPAQTYRSASYHTTYTDSYKPSYPRPLPTLHHTSAPKRSNVLDPITSTVNRPMRANHDLYSPKALSTVNNFPRHSPVNYKTNHHSLPPVRGREGSGHRAPRAASLSRASSSIKNGSGSNNKARYGINASRKNPVDQENSEDDHHSAGSSNSRKSNPTDGQVESLSKFKPKDALKSSLYVGQSSREDATNNNRHQGSKGLNNLGNTCYMNSALQCISNTRPLKIYFMGPVERDCKRDRKKLVLAVSKLLKDMWTVGGPTSVAPNEVKREFSTLVKRFQGYGQHDSQEFLILLLEELHEEVNRKDKKQKQYMRDEDLDKMRLTERANAAWKWYRQWEDSVIVDNLVGQLRSALKCTVCQHVSDCFDPYWGLPLPVKKAVSMNLSDCFRLFTETEYLDKDEKPTCGNCKMRQKCSKTFTIWRMPKYLVVHLKRFEFLSYGRHKINTPVQYPLHGLDLRPYVDKEAAPEISPHYNLYAVVCHDGSATSGHYYAYCRHPENTNKWYRYNDSQVTQVDIKDVQTPHAYILFYEAVDVSNPSTSANL